MLTIDKKGRVFRGSNEVTYLTEHEQDALCSRLYPNDPVLRDQQTFRRRSISFAGHRLSDVPEASPDAQQLFNLNGFGGPRLEVLYQCNMRFAAAATELGLPEHTLRKWFARFRRRVRAAGFTRVQFEAGNNVGESIQ